MSEGPKVMKQETVDTEAPDPIDGIAWTLDHLSLSTIAKATNSLSPATMALAGLDWMVHLACAPGKQLQLATKASRKIMRLADYVAHGDGLQGAEPAITPLPQDHRFDDEAWWTTPYGLITQSFLLNQQWWHAATTGVPGVSKHHEDIVEFASRQMLDMAAPTNFIATNPVLQKRIIDTYGQCLVDGARYFMEDLERQSRGLGPVGTEEFAVGEKLAVTPGKVVFRNDLIELIQYEPTTEKVRPEPVLFVPAWIMKYYILDLSPENSLVAWLRDQGFTVFMISWHNPQPEDRNLDFNDYLRLGPLAALDAVTEITGAKQVHAAGYCLGGTLLSIAAGELAYQEDDRLKSVTLFAAQTDFSEPGELGLFIDEAQVNLLEASMWSQGYLDSNQMGGAFQMLRSNDLVWSRVLNTYLMGEREAMIDLMAWNADGTRLPYAMHSQYLRHLFLEDELAKSRYRVDGHTITLSAVRQPFFVVGTERDHVAPWKSVHKLHMLTEAEVTFVLTKGGHNAGIVSEPGHPRRYFHQLTRAENTPTIDPDDWLARAEKKDGSWWIAWGEWLGEHSGDPVDPPAMGAPDKGYAPICAAPGTYVLER